MRRFVVEISEAWPDHTEPRARSVYWTGDAEDDTEARVAALAAWQTKYHDEPIPPLLTSIVTVD
jgi:hypothetical protein